MVFDGKQARLRLTADLDVPGYRDDQVLIKVRACAVCRTDLHIIDGDLKCPVLPIIPGHEIVGEIIEAGNGVEGFKSGDIVGVPWLGETCGKCKYCLSGRENLCDFPVFTGFSINGGYAEYTAANYKYCFKIPAKFTRENAAPLLCAGLIGYRSYKMVSEHNRIGLYGFGAAAHIITQVARYQGKELYAFTKPGDIEGQSFAKNLGCSWAGDSDTMPPETLDAAIIYAPVGDLLPIALRAVCKGGIVVCAGIHMSDIPRFPYEILWGEKVVRSVANLTRKDGKEFFQIADEINISTEVTRFGLDQANTAVDMLRRGQIKGAGVLVMD